MASLSDRLESLLGKDYVKQDEGERRYYSTDLSMIPGEIADVVVQPASSEEVCALLRLAAEEGAAVVPRGGGMTYTHTFVPKRPGSVLLDMTRMNRILEVSSEDLFIVAEAGATWEEIYLAASASGTRTPYWGPLSGRYATVGGTLSNNSVFFGSTRYGSAAESVLGLELALANGSLLHTGAWAQRHSEPFMRYYGPDTTGLFLGDAGTLGIKTQAALRLIPLPDASVGLAFSVPDLDASNSCILEMGRTELAAEAYAFDPLYNGVFADLGFTFLQGVDWSVFVVVDACDPRVADAAVEVLREIGLRHGDEIDPSVPMAVRADPFGAVPQVLMGPKGEIWLPLHGLFPASKAKAASDACFAFVEKNRAAIEEHGIKTSYLTMAFGKDYLIEPSFYWHDEVDAFRNDKLDAEQAAEWAKIPANPAAREVGLRLRRELAAIFDELGAVHLQIGKYYEFAKWIEPSAAQVLGDLKNRLDPSGILNPGALGLPD